MEKVNGRRRLAGLFVVMWAYLAIFCLKPLETLDELWIYNMGQEMSKGAMPYRDFTSIVTPVSFLLSGFFLYIFGQELMVLRVLGAMVFAGVCLLFYMILREETEAKTVSAFFAGMLCIVYGGFYTYDYNWLMLLEVLPL